MRAIVERAGLAWAIAALCAATVSSAHHSAGDTGTLVAMAASADSVIHPRVQSEVQRAGIARVLVSIRTDDQETVAEAAVDDARRHEAIYRSQSAVVEAIGEHGFELLHRYEYVPAMLGRADAVGLGALADHPLVTAVQPDRVNRPLLAEHVSAVNGDVVHRQLGMTGEGITVAVLDTGIDTDHPDLADDIVAQKCYSANGGCGPNNATEGPDAEDEDGHGTSVAGIISSKGTVSSVGIAPDAGIVAIRVFDDRASAASSDIIKGFDWLIKNRRTLKVKIVNMSLGGGLYRGACDREDQARADAIAELNARGVAVFAASGNDGAQNALAAPACISNVIAVGATYDAELGRQPPKGTFGNGCFDETTSSQTITCFSNVSRALSLVAPGAVTEAPALDGGIGVSFGTSNASPMAAGVAALVLQADSSLRPAQLKRLLETTGTPVRHPVVNVTVPLVDAFAAVADVLPPTPTPTATTEPSPTASRTATATTQPTSPSTATPTASPTRTPTLAATTPAPATDQPTTTSTPLVDPTVGPSATDPTSYLVYLPIAEK